MKKLRIGIVFYALFLSSSIISQHFEFEEIDEILKFIEIEVIRKNNIDNVLCASEDDFVETEGFKLLQSYLGQNINFENRVEICTQEYLLNKKIIHVKFFRKPSEEDSRAKYWQLLDSPLNINYQFFKKFKLKPLSYVFNFKEYSDIISNSSTTSHLQTSNFSSISIQNINIYNKKENLQIDNLFFNFRKTSRKEWLLFQVGRMGEIYNNLSWFYERFNVNQSMNRDSIFVTDISSPVDLRIFQRNELEIHKPILIRVVCGNHPDKNFLRLSLTFKNIPTKENNEKFIRISSKTPYNYDVKLSNVIWSVEKCINCSKELKVMIEKGGILKVSPKFSVKSISNNRYKNVIYIDFFY